MSGDQRGNVEESARVRRAHARRRIGSGRHQQHEGSEEGTTKEHLLLGELIKELAEPEEYSLKGRPVTGLFLPSHLSEIFLGSRTFGIVGV
jgi:hypothetical protein